MFAATCGEGVGDGPGAKPDAMGGVMYGAPIGVADGGGAKPDPLDGCEESGMNPDDAEGRGINPEDAVGRLYLPWFRR